MQVLHFIPKTKTKQFESTITKTQITIFSIRSTFLLRKEGIDKLFSTTASSICSIYSIQLLTSHKIFKQTNTIAHICVITLIWNTKPYIGSVFKKKKHKSHQKF